MSSKRYNAEITLTLTNRLARKISGENAGKGEADIHMSEGVAQDLLAKLLGSKLPNHGLVRENEGFPDNASLKDLIPDILIDRTDDKTWGVVELKMLLKDDRLSAGEVERDLDKLCMYKEALPHIAAYFLLVGSRAKLFSPQRSKTWAELKITYERHQFDKPGRQDLENGYSAVPAGKYDNDDDPIVAFLWEIIPGADGPVVRTPDYAFDVTMFDGAAAVSTPARLTST